MILGHFLNHDRQVRYLLFIHRGTILICCLGTVKYDKGLAEGYIRFGGDHSRCSI